MTSQDASRDDKLMFQVVGGPSKFDLMLSLFDGNKTPRRTVDFQLEGVKGYIRIAITTVQQEDGSGESWNYEGHLWHDTERHYNIIGYFSTKGRRGTLEFLVPFSLKWNDTNRSFDKIITPEEKEAVLNYANNLKR